MKWRREWSRVVTATEPPSPRRDRDTVSLTGVFSGSDDALLFDDDHRTSWAELTRHLCVDIFAKDPSLSDSAALLESRTVDAVTFDIIFQPTYFPGKMGLRAYARMEMPNYVSDPRAGAGELPDPFSCAAGVIGIVQEPLDDVRSGPDSNEISWRIEGLNPELQKPS